VTPPKPEVVKPVEPVKPAPVTPPKPVEPPKPEVVKVDPPKPVKPDPPKPPPVDPEVAKLQKRLDEAAGHVSTASPFYREVVGSIRNMPQGQEELRGLLAKGKEAESLLVQARYQYADILSNGATDRETLERRLNDLDALLSTLRRVIDRIKTRVR
jgi:hypothetical protein